MYYLILDSDFAPTAVSMNIIQASPSADALLAKKVYDPAAKVALANTGLTYTFITSHDVLNTLSGQVDPGAIYKT